MVGRVGTPRTIDASLDWLLLSKASTSSISCDEATLTGLARRQIAGEGRTPVALPTGWSPRVATPCGCYLYTTPVTRPLLLRPTPPGGSASPAACSRRPTMSVLRVRLGLMLSG